MKVFNEVSEINNLALALGCFDGVHIGHKAVISSAVNYAREMGTKSAVITFSKNPLELFSSQEFKYIVTKDDRREHIEDLGVDYLFELNFTREMSKLSGQEYLENILIKNFKPISISTGFNHTFGANKSGNAKLLRDMQLKFHYKYFNIPAQKIDNEIVSSTLIKQLIIDGNIKRINTLLGYNYSISGKVIAGSQIGRKIGFPTANIEYPPKLITLPYGVYSTIVTIEGNNYPSITNFGRKPTICENCTPIVEVHILNFDKNIYNKNIKLSFIKKIRDEIKFNSIDELTLQIKRDITKC